MPMKERNRRDTHYGQGRNACASADLISLSASSPFSEDSSDKIEIRHLKEEGKRKFVNITGWNKFRSAT
jgi:hypothetical protein